LAEPKASPDAWTGRYEDLRRRVTEEDGRLPRGPEVTVFVRRGMAAWMEAWTEGAPCPLPRPVACATLQLPTGLYADIARLLVNMLFHNRQETLA
jgi:hypothetical protein